MKAFKTFLITLLAMFVGLGLIFGTFALIVGVMSDDTVKVKKESMLHLTLSGEIRSFEPENELNSAFGLDGGAITVHDIIFGLEKATFDDAIKGIVLQISPLSIGLADIEEIRAAIQRFKADSGKPVYSFMEMATNKEYLLASSGDKVFMTPEGFLYLNQLQINQTFLKNTLNKMGVEADYIHVGKYKSAPETFMRTNMSEANKEQMLALYKGIQSTLDSNLIVNRKFTSEQIKNVYSKALLNIEEAKSLGIIDDAIYWDEFQTTYVNQLDKYESVSLAKYKRVYVDLQIDRKNKIAIIYAGGAVMSGDDGHNLVFGNTMGVHRVARNIRKAVEDKKVKGILLRINSPGGSATASDILWREIKLARESKPVFASIGNLAASGGYYIAMACDKIIAHPNSIVGSIGVFMGKYNLNGLLNEKLGMTQDKVLLDKDVDINIFSSARKFTPEERNILQNNLNRFYKRFVTKAADSRAMAFENVEAVAQGRVWLAKDALPFGLIDTLGNFNDAIHALKIHAGIPLDKRTAYSVYPKGKTVIEQFGGMQSSVNSLIKSANIQSFETLINELATPKIYAMMPYSIDFN